MTNKPFAMFFNASPRKEWNTAKMLEAAKAGAEEAGTRTTVRPESYAALKSTLL